jgi:hypothetical protein
MRKVQWQGAMRTATLDIEIESSFVYSFGFMRVRVAPLLARIAT